MDFVGINSNSDPDDTYEFRYDSLRSLGKLVETDLQRELDRTTRRTLPIIRVRSVRQRSPTITDNVLAVTNKKRINQRLLATSNNNSISVRPVRLRWKSENSASQANSPEHSNEDACVPGDTSVLESDNDQDIILSTEPDSDTKTDSLDIEAAIRAIRKRTAEFEALKSERESAYEDDFQRFLGERYLELCKRQTTNPETWCQPSSITSMKTCFDDAAGCRSEPEVRKNVRYTNHLQKNNGLNVKIAVLARACKANLYKGCTGVRSAPSGIAASEKRLSIHGLEYIHPNTPVKFQDKENIRQYHDREFDYVVNKPDDSLKNKTTQLHTNIRYKSNVGQLLQKFKNVQLNLNNENKPTDKDMD